VKVHGRVGVDFGDGIGDGIGDGFVDGFVDDDGGVVIRCRRLFD